MFFKKRYFRVCRNSYKFFYFFNLFLNFYSSWIEFLGPLGYVKNDFLKNFLIKKVKDFISIYYINNYKKIFNFNNGYIYRLIYNMINGLVYLYDKKIFLFGLGYKVLLKKCYLHFFLSFSHPVFLLIPSDISVKIILNELIISGISKQRVGEVCVRIKNFKKPDLYKGKGIRYFNEKIFLKPIKKK